MPPLGQTSTFSANPVACAAGTVLLEALRTEHLPARAAELGAHLEHALRTVDVPGVRVEPIGRKEGGIAGLLAGADAGAFRSRYRPLHACGRPRPDAHASVRLTGLPCRARSPEDPAGPISRTACPAAAAP